MNKVGDSITFDVAPDSELSATVPGIGIVHAAPGSFSSSGSISVQRTSAKFSGTALAAAGIGIDVTFHGTTLVKPLDLTFHVDARPSKDAVPVLAHESHSGGWELIPATLDAGGNLSIRRSDFSLSIPGWLNPVDWWNGVTAKIASGVGGRTQALSCPSSGASNRAPSWFHLDPKHSDLVHVCAVKNAVQGEDVAEVQIKSNRGVTLEVDVPGTPAYVWTEGMPWSLRSHFYPMIGLDPNRTVLLPPGATMTIGYKRSTTKAPWSFWVTPASGYAVMDSFVRALISWGIGEAPGMIGATWAEAECVTGFSAGPGGFTFGAQKAHEFITCWFAKIAEELTAANIRNIARKVGGADSALAEKQLAELRGMTALGWLVTLWPAYQITWGTIFDKIHELLTNGGSSQINYYMDPKPGPNPGGNIDRSNGGGGSDGDSSAGAPAISLTAGGTASDGATWYSVSVSGFPASSRVGLLCHDSADPGGFATFYVGTNSSGAGADTTLCYSVDGPDHWVTGGGVTSNHVQWSKPPPPPPPPATYAETTGGETHTWSNYTNAGGSAGPVIADQTTIQVSCRLQGFKVADGNTWWYRVADPGNNTFYASADAFYNNGATSGSLRGTPWFDDKVPTC